MVLGEKLSELGYVGLRQFTDEIISVKVPVFSFAKLLDTEINLGPEMKSTGEVMGRAKNLARALYKGFIAAKVPVSYHGKALVTVADKDKAEIVELARALERQGFDIYATEGTCKTLQAAEITCKQVVKLQEGSTILDLIQQGEVKLVINTITHGKQPQRDGFKIRRAAVESGVLCFTSWIQPERT